MCASFARAKETWAEPVRLICPNDIDGQAQCIRHLHDMAIDRRQRIAGISYPFDGTLYVSPHEEEGQKMWAVVCEVITTVRAAIGEGIVIGVSSGLVLSLALWIVELVKRKYERRDQIRYIAGILARDRDRILGAETLPGPDGSGIKEVPKVQLRLVLYDGMRKELDGVFVGRASRLSFDQIAELKKPFFILDDNFNFKQAFLHNDQQCRNLFETLEAIKWLKLPPCPN